MTVNLDGSADYTLPLTLDGFEVNSELTMSYNFHSQGEGETCDGALKNTLVPVNFAGSKLKVGKFGDYDGVLTSAPLDPQTFDVTCVDSNKIPPVSTEPDTVGVGQVVTMTIKGQNQVYAINCTKPVDTIGSPPIVYTFTRQCAFIDPKK